MILIQQFTAVSIFQCCTSDSVSACQIIIQRTILKYILVHLLFCLTPYYSYRPLSSRSGSATNPIPNNNTNLIYIPDAWLTNTTQKIYSLPWRDSDRLWDSTSPKFKEYENTFCSEVIKTSSASRWVFFLDIEQF